MARRKLVWIFSLALCLFLAYSAMGEKGFIRLHQMILERENLKTRIHVLEEENSRLAEEVGLLSDDHTVIESLARIELGLVKPGETVYILPDTAVVDDP
jgi:cell division protein FtsB